MTEYQYPIFVYGTLMTGEGAHAALANSVERTVRATLSDASLLDLGAYPMVVAGSGEVAGEVCWLSSAAYKNTLTRLDKYEGPQYSRELKQIRADGIADGFAAWVYIGRETPSRATLIQGGDWRQRRNTSAYYGYSRC